jgi:hypothetical protein
MAPVNLYSLKPGRQSVLAGCNRRVGRAERAQVPALAGALKPCRTC